MEETAQQTSAFPAPPYYFKRYSKENLALLDHVKHATPSELQEDKSITQDIADLGYPLAALEPPPPITSGHYWQFGKPWPINDRLLTLEEQGCEQLYPKGPIDRVKELKKLNHSALFNFVELVHTLSTSPSQYAEKVEQIRLIFINMHHILNEYRPHQAKETLRLMMQEQLERKRRETQALRRTCQELREKLAGLRRLNAMALQAAGSSASSTIVPTATATTTAGATTMTELSASPSLSQEQQGHQSTVNLQPATENQEGQLQYLSSIPSAITSSTMTPTSLIQDPAISSSQWMDIDHV